MRALSIRQPWAWAILHAGKTIENRTWKHPFRGEILLHAAKGMTFDEFEDALRFIAKVKGWSLEHARTQLPTRETIHLGGVVGRAKVVSAIPPEGIPPSFLHPTDRVLPLDWHVRGQWGYVLEDVESLPFVPCSGCLGFWNVPESVLHELGVSDRKAVAS